ncbi:glycosyltransferase family 4 protein [Bacillus haimaensis]|uniref:glycosyltransferase family 4 protein n=1 Tax=Bacillus haimaensis TaxID=3160967 RepID=UPI003AA96D87
MGNKVIFFTEYVGLGGGETSLVNLCRRLSKEMEVEIITNSEGDLNRNLSSFELENSSIPYKKLIKRGQFVSLLLQLSKKIKHNAKVVILNSKSCLYLIPLIKLVSNCPIFYIEHSNWTNYTLIEKILLKNFVNEILVVSDPVSQKVKKQIGSIKTFNKIKDFPLMISMSGNQQKKRINANSPKIVAMIGRYQEIKGHSLFVDIAREVCETNDNVEFWIIGGKPFGTEEEIKYEKTVLNKIELSKYNKRIKVLGERKDVELLLKNSIDVLVVPSINESFGMVVLEASKYGVPTVTSNSCEGPSEILQNLNAKELIVEREIKAFKHKIIDLLTNHTYYSLISEKLQMNIPKYDLDGKNFILVKLINSYENEV